MNNQSDFQFAHVPVNELILDKANPRIARWIEMYGDQVTVDDMSLALGAAATLESADGGTTFHSLRESIRTNGGVIHPIIVNRTQGNLVVIEGNTRTVIYMEFADQQVPGEWNYIPAMVYDDLDQSAIDAIRLQAHLVGPREWDPYSKSKYLDFLRNSEHLTWSQIVDFCGGRRSEAEQYVNAYNDMEQYYRPLLISDDEFDPTRFSSFMELQKPNITTALTETQHSKSEFAQWVIEGLLQPQSMVRSLPRILRNEKSKQVFLDSGAREAVKVLDVPSADEAIREASITDLARELTRRVMEISYSEIQRLRSDLNTEENVALVDARDQLIDLCKDIAA